jgi:hypothetical protein
MLASILFFATAVQAQPPSVARHVGDAYEITLTRDSEQSGTNGSSGSSHDQDTVIERVIGVRPDGLELEYDLPADTPKEEKSVRGSFPRVSSNLSRGPFSCLIGQVWRVALMLG